MRIADSHNDFLTYYKTRQQKINYLYRLSYTNLKILNCVFWTTETKNPLKSLILNKKILDKNKTKIKLLYSIEDIGFCNLKNIEKFIENKIDFCGLVWNYNNTLGGGALDNGTITPLGKKIIRKLEENNILIDTAHMNRKTFNSFYKITTKPIYNSHSNIYDLCKHNRNLKDYQIKKIINSNGFLGLSFVKDFIKDGETNFTSLDVAKQISYFIKKYGNNNVGLGSDFFGTTKLPNNLKCYLDIKNLENDLISLGISPDIINKIFYNNYYDFLLRVGKI